VVVRTIHFARSVAASIDETPDRGGAPVGLRVMEITYRSFRPGDESQLLDLYNSVFAASRTAGQWWWEHADNPAGHGEIMLAFAGPRLIGHVGGIPLGFRQGRQHVRMSRIQHAVVHPDFQRRGVFTQTLVRLMEKLAAAGVDVAVAFPHDGRHSMPGIMRSGAFHHVFDMFRWVRRFPVTGRMPPDLHIVTDDHVRFDTADLRCAERLLASCAIRSRRDPACLNWRYHPASGRRYAVSRVWRDEQLAGWVVVKPYTPAGSLDLVECILPPEPELVSAVLGALAVRFRGAALDRFTVWSMEHYPLHACLTDLGFTAETRPTHVLTAPLSDRSSTSRIDPSAYYLAMGDSDVY